MEKLIVIVADNEAKALKAVETLRELDREGGNRGSADRRHFRNSG
jgi:hypothetical protein